MDLDIPGALAFHRSHQGIATAILASASRDVSSAWVDGEFRISALDNDGVSGDDLLKKYALTGAFIFEPQVFNLIPRRTQFDCTTDLLPQMIGSAENSNETGLWGYVNDGYWNPLNTFTEVQEAQRVILSSATSTQPKNGEETTPTTGEQSVRYPSLSGYQIAPGIWAGRNLAIHPSVRLAPPVYIGDNCQVGREVELGPLAILGENVIIDDEATVHDSVVLNDTYIGQLVNVSGRVVDRTLTIDISTGASTMIVDRFLLAETTPGVVSAGLGRLGDFIGAALLLLVLAPLIFLVCLAALLSSLVTGQGFRIFERKSRWGRSPRASPGDTANAAPRLFDMVYLATRRKNGSYTLFGRVLEALEFDRLPALWNVLAGDLRLVGVQPLTEDEVNASTEDWQRERLNYPAGFTGLWYVRTPRGADTDTTAVTDAYYVATRNWREDLNILWITPSAWIKRLKPGN